MVRWPSRGVSYDGATLTTAALAAGDFFGPALSGATAAEDTARAKGTVSIWRTPIDELRRLSLNYRPVVRSSINSVTRECSDTIVNMCAFAGSRISRS
jgi:CRP-like cAMP-binding protein